MSGRVEAVREGSDAILLIPDVEMVNTSERGPKIVRMMRDRHEVVGLRPTWDRLLYDPRRAKWPRVLLYALDKAILGWRGLLLARRHRVRVVFCESAHHAIAGLIVARVLGVRCVWDSHGNGKLFYESLRKGRLWVRLIATLEKFVGKRVDDLITVSPADAAAYAEMGLPPSKIHMIPSCVTLADVDSIVGPFRPDGEGNTGPPVLVFFGSFGYEPNREALEFINDVLAPHLERQGLVCEIRIAGRDIPQIDYHRFVRPLGFVPDIYSCIRSASLSIVPVRRGVGILVKVLDSMAVGTPVVLFEFGARGIPGIRHGVHAYVAATEEEFLRYVEEALRHPEANRGIATEARRLIERGYEWDSYKDDLDAILRGSGTRALEAGAT